MDTSLQKKENLNAQEAALILKCSLSKLYKLTHHREIRYYKYGGKVWFKQEDLEDYIERNSIEVRSMEDLEREADGLMEDGGSHA